MIMVAFAALLLIWNYIMKYRREHSFSDSNRTLERNDMEECDDKSLLEEDSKEESK